VLFGVHLLCYGAVFHFQLDLRNPSHSIHLDKLSDIICISTAVLPLQSYSFVIIVIIKVKELTQQNNKIQRINIICREKTRQNTPP